MKRTNESGRSMVEMLGVLAIIGVLSVGGIAGYTMAMNRYRSNEIIDMANKLAVVAFSARETYAAMHNGDSNGFTPPTLTSSGLYTSSAINGAKFTALTNPASFFTDTECQTAATVTQSARSVKIEIDFGTGGDNVCKAAASTLGTTCTGNKVTFCSRSS